MAGAGSIQARPNKALFVDMMTRDIGIADSILDLVDNSVDKAVELTGFDAMSLLTEGTSPKWSKRKHIRIDYSPTSFAIVDTCGGFGIDEARKTVFLLGNPTERGAKNGLSVFGIGLKRAIFKLGQEATIQSQTERERLTVEIDTEEWQEDPEDWTFDFALAEADAEPLDQAKWGTTVRVRTLRADVQSRFADPLFEGELRRRIAATYALFLTAGLQIKVNGEPVVSTLPTIGTGTVTPARRLFKWGEVDVMIVAGIAPRDDGRSHGWYVFCNGRMVVEADKSGLTGWGDGLPAFHHGKFRRFVGLVYFRSDDVRKLPWRTTKQGVDQDSEVYRSALREMAVEGRAVTAFLNTLYPSDAESDPTVEREVVAKAASGTLAQLSGTEQAFSVTLPPSKPKEMVSIQYSRPLALIDRIGRHLGKKGMSAKRVGEVTFDHFVEQELD